MGVLLVILAFVLVLRLVGLVVLTLADESLRAAQQPDRHTDPCLAPLMALTPPPDPESDLWDGLRSGRLDRAEYRAAMASLAERDARAHPLRMPGD